MATAPTLFFPSYSYERDGFDKQDKENSSRRLANRDALLKMSEEAASQGQSLTIEDMMRQSQATMGFGDFLRSTSPSVDMMNGMVQNQNAKAEQVKEERRRTQFQADALEGKTLTTEAKDLFLAGKSAVDVDAELRAKYGEDRVSKLRPQLDRIGGMAQHEAMKSGMEIGKTRFQNEFEAKEYVTNNSWLPKPEAEGILIGARNNQSATEKAIMADALRVGANAGFRGTADDALLAQNTIESMAGTLPQEQKAALTKRYLETAAAAGKQAESASNYKLTQSALETQAKNEPEVQLRALTLDRQDDEDNKKKSELAYQGYLAPLQRQEALAKEFANPKHPLSKEAKIEAEAGLRSYHFKDLSAYIKAVESGDPKQIAAAKAPGNAEPIASFMARAQGLSGIVSGAHKAPNVAALYSTLAEYSTPDETITGVGNEIRLQQKVQSTLGVPKESTMPFSNRVKEDGSVTPMLPFAANAMMMAGNAVAGFMGQSWGKEGTPGGDSKAEATSVVAAAVESENVLKSRFISDSAEYLKALRSAITMNGRLNASTEEIQAEELRLAMRRSAVLVKGMGLEGSVAEYVTKDLTEKILAASGSPQKVDARLGYGDTYRKANSDLGNRRLLPDETGRTPVGGLRPQSDPRYAPANF